MESLASRRSITIGFWSFELQTFAISALQAPALIQDTLSLILGSDTFRGYYKLLKGLLYGILFVSQ